MCIVEYQPVSTSALTFSNSALIIFNSIPCMVDEEDDCRFMDLVICGWTEMLEKDELLTASVDRGLDHQSMLSGYFSRRHVFQEPYNSFFLAQKCHVGCLQMLKNCALPGEVVCYFDPALWHLHRSGASVVLFGTLI